MLANFSDLEGVIKTKLIFGDRFGNILGVRFEASFRNSKSMSVEANIQR